MPRLKLKDSVKDAELFKYGFKKGRYVKHPEFIRSIDGTPLYRIYFTEKHRYLQILLANNCVVAGSLQSVIYNMTKDGILEEVEEANAGNPI